MFKHYLKGLLIAGMCLTLAGCSLNDLTKERVVVENKASRNGVQYVPTEPKVTAVQTEVIKKDLPLHMEYFENQLTKNESDFYWVLSDTINDGISKLEITQPIYEDTLVKLYVWYLNNQIGVTLVDSVTYTTEGNFVTEIEPNYRYSIDTLGRINADVETCISEIVTDLNLANLSDYEVILTMSKYIVDNCEYSDNINANDMYGVLFSGKAVCEGYAKTLAYFCNLYDIPSVLVVGEAAGGSHMWNKVKLNDKWYNIDLTWGDSLNDFDKYFLVSDEALSDTHKQDEDWGYPEATEDYIAALNTDTTEK